jgi:hypothetical protein
MGAARNLEPDRFTPEELAAAAKALRAQGFLCSPLPPYWIPTATAAAVLLRTPAALKRWRMEGRGPTPHTADSRVQYLLAEVLAYRIDAARAEW